MRTFVMLILIGVLGMPLVHALVTSSLVAQTSTQYGAWTHDVSQDDFSGETIETASVSGERLMLLVSCYKGKDYFMSIHFLGSAIFRDGSVALRWDEGLVEHYTFQDNNEHLSAATLLNPTTITRTWMIITKLRAHSELRVRVASYPNTTVTDRISLSGADQAIAALACAE